MTEPLYQFAQWWLSEGRPIAPPLDNHILETDHSLSMVIFRDGAFQVEQYMGKSNFTSSKHSHPFDQLIIFQTGKLWGRRGQDILEEPPWQPLEDTDSLEINQVLPRGHWHQIRSFERGFMFYNLQYWYDLKPTSAVVEYRGQSLGPLHDRIINHATE